MAIKKLLLKSLYFVFFFTIISVWAFKNYSYMFLSIESFMISFGKLFGLLGAYSILVQLMLMGRIKWIERNFGHDKLTRVHRKNGYFVISYILLHFTFILTGYTLSSGANLFTQLGILVKSYPDVWQALLALIIFIVIVVTSVTIARSKLKYESWYYVHLLIYAAILLSFGHQLKNGSDFVGDLRFTYFWYFSYTFVGLNFIYYRFVSPLLSSYVHRFTVQEVKQETDDVWSVYISGVNLDKFKIIPGQFVIVRFLSAKFWMEAHPFSVSSYPNKEYFRLSIKAVGDFTSLVSSIKKGTRLIVDGPHGTFTSENVLHDKVLLIAGGIGITPFRSILEDFLKIGKDVVLVYSNKTKKDVVFKGEFEKLSTVYSFRLINVFTEEGAKVRVSGQFLQNNVPDLTERAVFICGPVPMILAVSKDLKDIGVDPSSIHHEIFSF